MPWPIDPPSRHVAVTLSDATTYQGVVGFHCNVGGTVVLELDNPWTAGGARASIAYTVIAGVSYDMRVRRFLLTGSTPTAELVAVKV